MSNIVLDTGKIRNFFSRRVKAKYLIKIYNINMNWSELFILIFFSRGGPAFGGPGFGPGFQPPGVRYFPPLFILFFLFLEGNSSYYPPTWLIHAEVFICILLIMFYSATYSLQTYSKSWRAYAWPYAA